MKTLSPFVTSSLALLFTVGNVAASPTTTASPTPTVVRRTDALTVTANNAIYTLASTFVITDVPATRTFDFTLSEATGAPDGVSRKMYVINGQFPGPLIEANEGDTIVVNVENDLSIGNGIHWHGMTQNGTAWADGVPGITQCPIPAGGSFTYRFKITEQYGTYWYHSHFANTMADGLLGPIVVHSPSESYKLGIDYAYDRIIMIGDWMHDLSDDIVAALLTVEGYHGSQAAPPPDALLINGVGVYDCSSIADGTSCTTRSIPEVEVVPNAKYRFRLINHSSHVHYKFSIDDHPLNVTAADGTDVVGPTALHQLPIGIAQRYDFILDTSVGTSGSAYYIRAAMCSANIGSIPSGFDITAVAALRYVADGATATTGAPTSSDWSDSVNTDATCYDLPEGELAPRIKTNAPTSVLDSTVLSSVVGFITNSNTESIAHFFFNSVAWANYIYKPLLFDVQAGRSLNSSAITHAVFDSGIGGADIILNNQDGFIDHPYHLHGNPFFLVARGTGVLTAAKYAALGSSDFNTTNPLRRDTITIPRSSYAVLRIITDNTGIFPLHCHIGWHLAVGKMAAIVVNSKGLEGQTTPSAVTHLCDASNIPAGDTVDTVAVGKRFTPFDTFRAMDGLSKRFSVTPRNTARAIISRIVSRSEN